MTNTQQPIAVSSPPDHIFPTLTGTQLERMATLGRVRSVRRDEILVDEGQRQAPFFVVRTGEVTW